MLTILSRWFEPAQATQEHDRPQYALLCLILAAGVWLRFWGLGNVGLHGDEETTAMAALAVLERGGPSLDSGMFYARAPLQTYILAASAWLFGQSEWAFRLPSAVTGSLAGLAAFFMGRRFLVPAYNLGFVATLTFLPYMIEVSQTARMYVFFVTCMMFFVACIFRWERNQRLSSLALALLVWALGLQFHSLAIFLAPLFLFPGLTRQSWRRLGEGAVAFAIAFYVFSNFNAWIMARYPQFADRPADLVRDLGPGSGLEVLAASHTWLILGTGIALAALAAFALYKVLRSGQREQAGPLLLVGAGLLAMAFVHYHVGGILLLLGAVFWLRAPALPRSWLAAAITMAIGLAIMHLVVLHASGLYPGRKLIGALVGQPSLWPTLRFIAFGPAAIVVVGAALLVSVARFSGGRRLPNYVLFLLMGVWVPLLLMGFIRGDVVARYTAGQLPLLLLCAFAGLAYLLREPPWGALRALPAAASVSLIAVASVAFVNPVALARTANPSYGMYPDHKGAAEYIRSLALDPAAILVAEDILQQTYYLGKVDYWLRQIDDAKFFLIVRDGRAVDQYTATPVLGTGADLEALLDSSHGANLFVIGSGEDFFSDGTRAFRERGIREILESDRFTVVHEGRDGRTRVWKQVR